ncbi:MAG: hypothetical protein M1822_006451 [Bathelium mastoideum]|nr:MAG: hypothetical protein M1822_006451 [Bathelium mastoideum]
MASPIPYDPSKVERLQKAHDEGYVVGLHEATGVVERKDIDILLLEQPLTFNLFLLALYDLQNDPKLIESPMGYFEIAGIHGLPKRPWNGDQNKREKGYCEHAEIVFPTWHRVYIAMMEQAIYLRMVKIAGDFHDSKDHLDAAQKFRLPYWDYYRPRDYGVTFPGVIRGKQTSFPYEFNIPQIFNLEKVVVRAAPEGNKKTLSNPLCSFWFPFEGGLDNERDWTLAQGFSKGHTVRHPLKFSKEERQKNPNLRKDNLFQGDNQKLQDTLNEHRACLLTTMKYMLLDENATSGYAKYRYFASRKYHPGSRCYGSLEDFHNSMHDFIGSEGHMGTTSIAAFDPVFWMHHCNIDRYLAVWQAINSDWFDDDPDELKKPLYPFLSADPHATKGYWNSSLSKQTEDFGYVYPDIVPDNAKATRNNFLKLEAWSLNPNPRAPAGREPLDLSSALVFTKHPEFTPLNWGRNSTNSATTGQIPLSDMIANEIAPIDIQAASPLNKAYDWFIDNSVERMALNGSFGIYYFIGPASGAIDVPPERYIVAPTLAGISYNFAGHEEACSDCARHASEKLKVTGTTYLNPQLADYVRIGELRSLDPEDIKPFLVNRLKWRILTANGKEVNPRILARDNGLEFNITSTLVTGPEESPDRIITEHPEIVAEIIRRSS